MRSLVHHFRLCILKKSEKAEVHEFELHQYTHCITLNNGYHVGIMIKGLFELTGQLVAVASLPNSLYFKFEERVGKSKGTKRAAIAQKKDD